VWENVTDIIHLAGAGIADKRWTKRRKKTIVDSRIKSAKLLYNEIKMNRINLDTFISASAVGWYGSSGSIPVIETKPAADSFIAQVCKQWEDVADEFRKISARVVKFRIGLVLSSQGGFLSKLGPPIRIGLGPLLGTGKNWQSWISIDDLCRLFLFALEKNQIQGVYNAVSPNSMTQKKLIKSIGNGFGKSIQTLPSPPFIIRLIFGEMSTALLQSVNASPDKILASGFEFHHSSLNDCVKYLYSNNL